MVARFYIIARDLLLRKLQNYLGCFLAIFPPRFRLVLANRASALSKLKKLLRKPLQIILQFPLLATLVFAAPVFAEEYQIEEVEGKASDICIPDEECDKAETCSSNAAPCTRRRYRNSRRYRRRCRYRKRRCCCYSQIEASWPGKMESFMDEMTK